MTAAGVRPLVLTADMGGELVGQNSDEMYTRLGLTSRLRAPETHFDGIESVHRRLCRSVQPAMLAGDVLPSLWEEACVWAIDAQNCRAVAGAVHHTKLCGS